MAEVRVDLERKGLLAAVVSICDEHGVTLDDVMGQRRHKSLMRARQHAWAMIRERTTMSYPEIGALFSRDHSTVIYGVQTHNQRHPTETGTLKFKPERVGFDGMGEGAGI